MKTIRRLFKRLRRLMWHCLRIVCDTLANAYELARYQVRYKYTPPDDENPPPVYHDSRLDDLTEERNDYLYLLDCATDRYENAGRQETAEKAKRQIIAYRKAIKRIEQEIAEIEKEG